ncbi:DNA polymerase III subunit beta [Parvibium lacunae]|uniref:Beta sliding clamp n=1 Tax=Parvibium lacunae TaxID=1888893 RepID=A0A368L0U7_9BURK|nr:DNA polymerase III subunit beta [Parvibium lacunae]RCS57027.1 DNA polymerase III subunit beta [Parvibium lacunae]
MLLAKTTRDAILKPLQTVSGIVERRHTLPILANILLRKQGQQVAFLSTDVEIQIQTIAELGGGHDEFATTVGARKLLDILRALPEGEVSLSFANKKLTIQAGKSRFNLQTMAADEFPTVVQPPAYDIHFSLPQKTLKHLFSMVHFAMAQQDIRYYLNGLLFVVEGQQVRAVATDGHRLAFCSTDLSESLGKQEVIIPRKTILELQRLLDDSEEPVQIDIAPNQIRFRFAQIELVSKLVEGKFPDYQRVIPQNHQKKFVVHREMLLHSLQRVAILTSDKFKGVRCVLASGSLKLSSTNADQEDAHEELEINYNAETIDIGFNVSYLLDVLNNLKSEQIQLAMQDQNSSALLTLPEQESFKYVVMPMRI